jgi:uncharacterized membrane protein YuzA (DUF378 family)
MKRLHKLAHMFAIAIVIIGAINWLSIGVIGYNPVAKIFGARSIASRGVYILVGLSAVALMFHRDTYLPFLGETVLPCSALPEQIPEGADTRIQVKVTPKSKVLFWAAEPSTEGLKKINDWRQAYIKFMNVGVVMSDENGVATLYVRNPQPYTVPWMGRIEPHVHFRVCGDGGMMGAVKTVYMSSGDVEEFIDIANLT